MAWKDNLQDASYKGVKFDVQSTDDDVEHALSEHAYPYKDGADIEDLGRRKRTFSFKVLIWGDDYESELQSLIKILDEQEPGELIHPIYGSVPNVLVQRYHVSHQADDVDYCTVDLDLAESITSQDFFTTSYPSQKIDVATMAQTTAQGISFDMFDDLVNTVKGNIDALDKLKNTAFKYIDNIRGLTSGVSLLSDVINYPLSFCTDIAQAARGLIDLRGFTSLSLKSDWGTLKSSLKDIVLIDKNVKSSYSDSDRGSASLSVPPQQQLPTVAYTDPATVVTATVKTIVATESSTCVCEILKEELEEPTLSPDQIDSVVNDGRELLNDAIAAIDVAYTDQVTKYELIESLKVAAEQLTKAGQLVVEARPPLIARTAESDTSFHLLAFRWYGSYARADELVRLNPQIRSPNKILKGSVIYGYSK